MQAALQLMAFLHRAHLVHCVRVLLTFSFLFQLVLFFFLILPYILVSILFWGPIAVSVMVRAERFLCPALQNWIVWETVCRGLLSTGVLQGGEPGAMSSFTGAHLGPFTGSRMFCWWRKQWDITGRQRGTQAAQPRGQQSWWLRSKTVTFSITDRRVVRFALHIPDQGTSQRLQERPSSRCHSTSQFLLWSGSPIWNKETQKCIKKEQWKKKKGEVTLILLKWKDFNSKKAKGPWLWAFPS